jgi:hypothetical protein
LMIELLNVEIGRQYRLDDPANAYHDIVLTVSHIENDVVVRFIDAPFDGFGVGINMFLTKWILLG